MDLSGKNRDILADDALTIEIVYEDEWLVVVNKPSRMPSHILREGEKGTLVNALVARYPSMAKVGVPTELHRECGIIHRLDTDTSGLVLAAKTQMVFETLRRMVKEGDIDKGYLALCVGNVAAPQTIDFPLASHPKNKRKVIAYKTDKLIRRYKARPAETFIETSSPRKSMSLVKLKAVVAGRHQIRVHLAVIGHPLAGDVLYGGPTLETLGHHFLHAHRMAWVHPVTKKDIAIEIPLSNELERALESL